MLLSLRLVLVLSVLARVPLLVYGISDASYLTWVCIFLAINAALSGSYTHMYTSTCQPPPPRPMGGSLRPTSASQVSTPTFSQGPIVGVTLFWAA